MPEVTQADIDDLGGINPFALEPARSTNTTFVTSGKKKLTNSASTSSMLPPRFKFNKTTERFFSGRIWVDDQELQNRENKGKGVPEDKSNKFPTVETYREHIDGRFWFPATYIRG